MNGLSLCTDEMEVVQSMDFQREPQSKRHLYFLDCFFFTSWPTRPDSTRPISLTLTQTPTRADRVVPIHSWRPLDHSTVWADFVCVSGSVLYICSPWTFRENHSPNIIYTVNRRNLYTRNGQVGEHVLLLCFLALVWLAAVVNLFVLNLLCLISVCLHPKRETGRL